MPQWTQQIGSGFKFECSPCALWGLIVQPKDCSKLQIRSAGYSELLIGLNMSGNGCFPCVRQHVSCPGCNPAVPVSCLKSAGIGASFSAISNRYGGMNNWTNGLDVSAVCPLQGFWFDQSVKMFMRCSPKT